MIAVEKKNAILKEAPRDMSVLRQQTRDGAEAAQTTEPMPTPCREAFSHRSLARGSRQPVAATAPRAAEAFDTAPRIRCSARQAVVAARKEIAALMRC